MPGPPSSVASLRNGRGGVCGGSGAVAGRLQGIGGAKVQVRAFAVAGASVQLPCFINLLNRIWNRISESGVWLVQSITARLAPLPHCALYHMSA